MGLDMYLTKKSYVKNWRFEKKQHQINVSYDNEERKDIKADRIMEIVEEVMYWRKANHIHGWFVEHIQGGIDECQESHVSREDLETLADLCDKVVEEKNAELLPPVQGFFFGSREVDEFYWEDTKETARVLRDILNEEHPEGSSSPLFYYQASW